MKSIKEECLRYSLVCGVKFDFKQAEEQNENLKEKLQKLQNNCMVLNSLIILINWKIQQAAFVLGCEKKKQSVLYEFMKIAESKYAENSIDPGDRGNGNLKFMDYLCQLEKKKTVLMTQVKQKRQMKFHFSPARK